MVRKKISGKRLFVLDTNVLMHDPSALFRFDEHDVYLPMVVLEELDNSKKGLSEVSRNVRQVNRYLDELMGDYDCDDISNGLQIESSLTLGDDKTPSTGKIYFQTKTLAKELPLLPGIKADNSIIGLAHALQDKHSDLTVTLVSKDINMRIKAMAVGVHAEDYYNDRTSTRTDNLYLGTNELENDFWETHGKDVESWSEEGRTFYKVTGPDVEKWYPNNFIYTKNGEFSAIVRDSIDGTATIEVITDYSSDKNAVWGIKARNKEQNFALNLLMDPDVDFVSLQGSAGSGKTLMALCAGLAQVIDEKRYLEIIMTRVTVPVGEDIGFLPGTEEEKMTPWMGALMDNLEVLNSASVSTDNHMAGDWERQATNDLIQTKIKIRSLNFMRGRTFLNRYIIIDEAQNLTPKQVKTLVTRAGPGTKIVCLGDIAQIDTPYLTENSSGLSYVIERFKHWEHSAHVTLKQGERSRLTDNAAKIL